MSYGTKEEVRGEFLQFFSDFIQKRAVPGNRFNQAQCLLQDLPSGSNFDQTKVVLKSIKPLLKDNLESCEFFALHSCLTKRCDPELSEVLNDMSTSNLNQILNVVRNVKDNWKANRSDWKNDIPTHVGTINRYEKLFRKISSIFKEAFQFEMSDEEKKCYNERYNAIRWGQEDLTGLERRSCEYIQDFLLRHKENSYPMEVVLRVCLDQISNVKSLILAKDLTNLLQNRLNEVNYDNAASALVALGRKKPSELFEFEAASTSITTLKITASSISEANKNQSKR